MKKIFLLGLIFSTYFLQAQTIQDFFADKAGTVTWLGIDYSHVKLAGEFTQFKDAGPISPEEIRDKYFPAWNTLMIQEASKYDFKGMFMLSALPSDLGLVTAVNAAADPGMMKDGNLNKFTCQDISGFIKNYALDGKEGLGIVLIADILNKTAESAGYFVTVFNMKSKEVLLCEYVTEKAGGIGIRNYWAGSLYNMVKDGKKSLYWAWKSKYSK
jgi:hypothetical protein